MNLILINKNYYAAGVSVGTSATGSGPGTVVSTGVDGSGVITGSGTVVSVGVVTGAG